MLSLAVVGAMNYLKCSWLISEYLKFKRENYEINIIENIQDSGSLSIVMHGVKHE